MTSDKSYTGWYFLGGVFILYLITFFINSEKVISAVLFSKTIFLQIIPMLFLIFILMALTNYFLQPKTLMKYLGKTSGIKGWIIVIIAGILSAGPIYMWYPLLNDLQKKGMSPKFIATFLYNRAVKIPLLPLLITYFGLVYSIVLMIVMIFISVIQGIVTEKILYRSS